MYRLVDQSNATIICLKNMKICFGHFVNREDLLVSQNTTNFNFNVSKNQNRMRNIDSLNIKHKANLNLTL